MKRSQKEPEEQDLNEITMDVEILSISESTPEVSTPVLSLSLRVKTLKPFIHFCCVV